MPDVNASKTDLDHAMFSARWLGSSAGAGVVDNNMTRSILSLEHLNSLYNLDPNLDPDKAMERVLQFQREYDAEVTRGESYLYQNSRAEVDLYQLGVIAFGAIPGALPLANETYERFIKDPIMKAWEPINEFTATKRQYQNWVWANGQKDNILNEALKKKDNEKFALAHDALFANTHGSIKDVKATTIIHGVLRPETAQKLAPKVNADGSLSLSLDELRAMVKGEFAALALMVDDEVDYLKSIDQQQKEILDWIKDEERRRRTEAERQEKEQAYQLMINGANSAVYLLSTFAKLGGEEKLSKEIMVVGSSAIQVYDSVKKFADAVSKFGSISEALFSMSGAIMTGNIVGAVMNVFSLFGSAEPSPEQMILEQIGKLREQVDNLRKEMHERFDRIERSLEGIQTGINAIYELLMNQFSKIDVELGKVQGDVRAIQQELSRQEWLLNQLGTSIHKGIQDLSRQPLVETINGAIGYKDTTGNDMLFDKFQGYENTLYSWVVDFAHGENEQPVAGRPNGDDDVLLQLESSELEENVMYLSGWLKSRNLPPLTLPGSAPLANPITWAISARAYAELRAENPRYAVAGGFPQRNAAVEKEGERLHAALRSITVEDAADGPKPNYKLFEELIKNYKDKATELDDILKGIETAYLSEWKDLKLKRGAGGPNVDPWGGAQQTIAHTLPVFPPDTPSTVASFIPAPYVLADFMKLDYTVSPGQPDVPPVSTAITPYWADEWEEEVELHNGNTTTRLHGKLAVSVAVKYKGTPILVRQVVGNEITIAEYRYGLHGEPLGHFVLDLRETFNRNWTGGQNLKAKFEASSQETSPPVVLDTVVKGIEDTLRKLREDVYVRVLTELDNEVKPQRPLMTRRLDGAKVLLDRFINLGMPLALESDDFLRALLYGTQSLVDGVQLKERYYAAWTDARPGGENESTGNVRPAIRTDADSRADALFDLLKSYLGLIGEKKHGEVQPIVGDTLLRSRTTSVVVSARNQTVGDTMPPETIIVSGPSGSTSSTSASFSFSSSEPASTFECSLDGAPFTPCVSPKSYSGLSSGNHTFRVRAVDAARNVDSTPASRTWTVAPSPADKIKPTVTPVSPRPGSQTRDRTPTIAATVRDTQTNLSKGNVRLFIDGPAAGVGDRQEIKTFSYNPATDMLAYTPPVNLPLGTHTVLIQARDTAGNVGVGRWSFKVAR